MNLVKFALKFRITFYVLAVLILLGGIGASVVANKDVLPNVDIPVVVVSSSSRARSASRAAATRDKPRSGPARRACGRR